MTRPADIDLGLDQMISRRDFMNGVLVAGASMVASSSSAAAAQSPYPPSLDGQRGSHTGSFEVAHAVAREGARFAADVAMTDDEYDLVIIGAGLSGLAAAFFYRRRKPDARVLLIDNHDDFGGHAKRNEFDVGGRTLIGYGGSQSIDGPAHYSAIAKGLLTDLDIDVGRFHVAFDDELYARFSMRPGVAFDAPTFTRRTVVPGAAERLHDGARPGATEGLPLTGRGHADLARLMGTDFMAGVPQAQRVARLKSTSYDSFLRHVAGAGDEVAALVHRQPNTFWGLNFDALSALEGYRLGGLGFTGLHEAAVDDMYPDDEPYIFHFPDGNAAIARLLVRQLIPSTAKGSTMADIVTAPFDYAALDRGDDRVRIRLASTAVRVIPGGAHVDIVYANAGNLSRVRAKRCILACYPRMIPHILRELPTAQREAMAEAVRTPLVYTNVVLRNWRSFVAAGVDRLYCPTGPYADIALDFPVSLGDYRCPQTPDEPIVVHMATAPVPGDGSHPKHQFKAGRATLLETSFTDMERDVRTQLTNVLGPYGFDARRDILALTINRWPHGYAREFNELFDTWSADAAPWIAARVPFGNIAMAASDTQGRAYVDAAVDAAHRAVGDLLD